MKRLTTEDFKKKFKDKFGDLYNLDKVIYVNNKTEVTVTCPFHGDFKKRPDLLLSGCKCPKCSKTVKTSEEDFFEKAKYVHNGFFDYVKGTFKNVSSPVGVICPIHGTWYPKANNHLNGANCPKCSKEGIKHNITFLPKKNKSTSTYGQNTLLQKIEMIHGKKYLFDKVKYVNSKTPISLICKEHGDFLITPNHLLSGRGCPKCSKNYHYTTEEIIEEFKKIHNEKYDYSKTVYSRTHENVIVTCPKHGDFEISPSNHLRGQGCPVCKNSKLEEEIMNFLDEKNIEYKLRERSLPWLNNLELDFYLPKQKIAIECQGIQHFVPIDIFEGEEGFKKRIENDNKKRALCHENGIKLLYYSNLHIDYPYFVYEDKEEMFKENFVL